MKKTLIAFLVLASFCIASSVHAFFDPINAPVTAIFGGLMAGINAPKSKIDDRQALCIHVQDQKLDQTQKQTKSNPENALTSPLPVPVVGGKLLNFK